MNRINLIEKRSPFPRYHQVKERIKEAIVLGKHKVGERIPSERKLVELFGVSRITIRKAIEEMVREGILEKEWGIGTIVKSIPQLIEKKIKIGLTCWHGEEYSYHPATLSILKGIGEVLKNTEFGIEVLFITPELIKNKNYKEFFSSFHLKGVIMIIQEIPENDLDEIERIVPFIVYGNRLNRERVVLFNYERATYNVVKYLIELGHKEISILTGYKEIEISNMCLRGYRRALEEEGIEVKQGFIKTGYYSYEDGYKLTEELLEMEEKPTAIICGDDFMGIGAIDSIEKNGMKCPDDISVISFGDFPIAKHTSPSLTTVKIPWEKMGRYLTEMLIDFIRNGEKHKNITIEGEIIERESVKRIF